MRVKIGDEWYEPTPQSPIMLELTEAEKKMIREMPGHFFAQFHDDDTRTIHDRQVWMGKPGMVPRDSQGEVISDAQEEEAQQEPPGTGPGPG